MAIFGLWVRRVLPLTLPILKAGKVINKAGGLVYQRNFAGSLVH
jgi:hypothetical protein